MDNLLYFLAGSKPAMMIFVLVMANGLGVLTQWGAALLQLSALGRAATTRRPDDWIEWVTEGGMIVVCVVGIALWLFNDTFRLSANSIRDTHFVAFFFVVITGWALEHFQWLEARFNRVGMHVVFHLILYFILFPILFPG